MNVTIIGPGGIPLMCDEGDAPASSVWTDTLGKQHYACAAHNPMANVTMPLPMNFTSRPLCHACGQPISVGNLIRHSSTAG